ncbi:hypothetical protein [Microbacterium abyssi]|uniref:hypothetical protein n=1 Tax=Microbacterium abyssi TaxID=2782166 RepID=UPI001886CB8C|nr:hypothetical protein [Microbacterium sp. A18JL241]
MSEVNEAGAKTNASLLIRGAIWIAIGALIAAALVCVVWVLVGDQDGIIGRAFLTILLLAAFAGIAILEAGLAPRRPDWLALASMITWIVALIAGAIKIWLPDDEYEYTGGVGRFFLLLVIIGVLQLALLHVRLFVPATRRYVTTFTQVIFYVTIVMLVLLVAMLVFYLTFPDTFTYGDLYWRIVVALAILTAVGTTLIPLLNALFAPKKRAHAGAPQGYAVAAAPAAQQWPTYADGVTPLPIMPDGSPDWNAYYTGVPTSQQTGYGQASSFPALPQQGQTATQSAAAQQHPQTGLISSPDAPIGPDGFPVPPAGAPAAHDGIPGDASGSHAPEAPAAPEVPTVPDESAGSADGEAGDAEPAAPAAHVPPVPSGPGSPADEPAAPQAPTRPAPGAFPPPPPAPRQ